jgi:hypothetical protein
MASNVMQLPTKKSKLKGCLKEVSGRARVVAVEALPVEQPKPRTRLLPAVGDGTQRLDADVTELMFNRYR